jgi:hypothetical protein
MFVDPNICRPEYLSTRIFVDPNICWPEYLLTQIFVHPNICQPKYLLTQNTHRPKYLSTPIFIDPNICQPAYLSTGIFVHPNICRPEYLPTRIFLDPNICRTFGRRVFGSTNFRCTVNPAWRTSLQCLGGRRRGQCYDLCEILRILFGAKIGSFLKSNFIAFFAHNLRDSEWKNVAHLKNVHIYKIITLASEAFPATLFSLSRWLSRHSPSR